MGDLYGVDSDPLLTEGRVTDREPRCAGCGALLAEHVTRPWAIKCRRCKRRNGG